jgi:hypothetical protein
MSAMHAVQTCRWGAPTLSLMWPLWYDASQHEWSCTRLGAPRVLVDPAECRQCPGWAAVDRRPEARIRSSSQGCDYRRALVMNDAEAGVTGGPI